MTKGRSRSSLFSVQVITLVVICCLSVPQPTAAQILYGSIVGTVKDPSDAPVPGAAVLAVSRGTGLTRESTTNEVGAYNLPTLPPGVYDVKVVKEGFQSVTRTGVEVNADMVARVDLGLQVGSMAESITVSGGAATLQTDRADVGTELAGQNLSNTALPPHM